MEERQKTGNFLLRFKSKKLNIEIFPAIQWRSKWRYGKGKHFHPYLPGKDAEWWQERFRVRINGKWHKEKGKQYTFFSTNDLIVFISIKLAFFVVDVFREKR